MAVVAAAQVTRLLPDATGTTCSQRLEKVLETEHTHILRVPFRTENGILRKWISRFEVWPYLETFAEVLQSRAYQNRALTLPWIDRFSDSPPPLQDVANEIAGELQAKPDLIIGNYSDGNLVASLLAHKLGVTQVCSRRLAPPAPAGSLSFSLLLAALTDNSLSLSLLQFSSAPSPMPWRRPSTLARTYTGRSSKSSTTSRASSPPT